MIYSFENRLDINQRNVVNINKILLKPVIENEIPKELILPMLNDASLNMMTKNKAEINVIKVIAHVIKLRRVLLFLLIK